MANQLMYKAVMIVGCLLLVMLVVRQLSTSDSDTPIARIADDGPGGGKVVSPRQLDPPPSIRFNAPSPSSFKAPRAPRVARSSGRSLHPSIDPAPTVNDPAVPASPDAVGGGNGAVKSGMSEPMFSESVARDALSLVGMDSTAEQVWAEAINDPALTPDARKNLIEDLNEDGFPDPKNLTPDDLPLIANRLMLIQDLAPAAFDDTNAAAFAEAYKDLLNMYDKVTK